MHGPSRGGGVLPSEEFSAKIQATVTSWKNFPLKNSQYPPKTLETFDKIDI